MEDPKTNSEWQEAVNAADFMLRLDSAVQYGLIERIPIDEKGVRTADWHYRDSGVTVDRCIDILEKGKKLGYVPQEIK